jgi:hypothetical protein
LHLHAEQRSQLLLLLWPSALLLRCRWLLLLQ